MSNLFLHAPFSEVATLSCILGGEQLAGRPASLPDHTLGSDRSGLRVAPVPAAGGAVEGALLTPDADLRARIDYLMAAFGAKSVRLALRAGGAVVYAEVYRFGPDAAPVAVCSVPSPEHLARIRETVEEVMGHFGQRDASEMAGLLHGIGIRALGRARGSTQAPAPAELGAGFGREDVAPVERRFVYARYFGVEEHRLAHRRFDGTMSPPLDRAVFTSGDAVTVLPFDPRTGTVLLIEQFRAGVFARHDPRPWCLETVAGRCDRCEPPELTARREAREEAGVELVRLEQIAAYYPSPGTMSEYITAFVGEADLAGAGGTHGLAEENEDIRAVVVPLDRAVAAALSGEINNAPLILSLLWLERSADRLRRAWT